MNATRRSAPGCPGIPARWANAAKSGIGTAIAEASRVWYSTAEGILTEVFHPAPDRACVRTLGFIVTDGAAFCSDELTQTSHEVGAPCGAAPIAATRNTCLDGRYRIEKETICDPHADVILQRVRFVALSGDVSSYRLFCVLEPHLGDNGEGSRAEVGEHKGRAMLFAWRADGIALALACSSPWASASAGFVGTSDGRADLQKHGHFTRRYDCAAEGNVALAGEIDHRAGDGIFTLALGFGRTTGEAGHAALGAMMGGYETARAEFLNAWQAWSASLRECRVAETVPRLWTRSTTILKTLEAKRAHGGRVAALSTPWGRSKGPGIDGTYHLVWTRDLVECVGGLLAAGARGEVQSALRYLRSTQEPDGHWPQNMRLSGEPFWNDDELDEVALPVVFLHLVRREGLLTERELQTWWPMVKAAAGFIARRGPSSKRDRWEDVDGITPFTLAAEIVALLIAAEMAEQHGERVAAGYFRDLADEWNETIDTLLYRSGGVLADHLGVDGYYVRSRKPGEPFARILDETRLAKTEVSPDALALVRFGLRAPDDPRILSTVTVIDAILKTEFDAGPCWRRYPGDEYGEYDDGSPFDGHGVGRPWPLFVGERAHYELARGCSERAVSLLRTMESFANASGMLPEQVWDQADIPERGLVRGSPSGSAAPLGWAHGEYVKLCRSLMDGTVFDMPQHAKDRYVRTSTASRVRTWRPGEPTAPIPSGKTLRVALRAPGSVEWTTDDWASSTSTPAIDVGIGVFCADVGARPGVARRLRVRLDQERDGETREAVFSSEAP